MARRTLQRERRSAVSERDVHRQLFQALRTARLSRQLTQQELAQKLGLRQRQISDLERAAMDPRLSTVQNVARALDLELMLVPRHLIPVVEGLERATISEQPMYALDDDDSLEGSGDQAAVDSRRGRATGR